MGVILHRDQFIIHIVTENYGPINRHLTHPDGFYKVYHLCFQVTCYGKAHDSTQENYRVANIINCISIHHINISRSLARGYPIN